jgi:ferritin
MLHADIEAILNKQVQAEGESSQFYLSMASWADAHGLAGVAAFFYGHADEERMHMLKLVKFINERGGHAIIPAISEPQGKFKNMQELFEKFLDSEVGVTQKINDVVDTCLKLKDYTTHNFMQWYVSEQIEEEALARLTLDKLKLIGSDQAGLYLFDRDLGNIKQH